MAAKTRQKEGAAIAPKQNESFDDLMERLKIQNAPLAEQQKKAETRIPDLIKYIEDLPGFSIEDFERVTKTQYRTIQKWKRGDILDPHPGTLEAVRKYLRFPETEFKQYLLGSISLQDLTESQGRDLGEKLSIDQIALLVGRLDPLEQVSLLVKLSEALKKTMQQQQEAEAKQTEPVLIELSETDRKRIVNLINVGAIYSGKTVEILVKEGVDGGLLTNLEEGKAEKVGEELLKPLISRLPVPIMWSKDQPVVEPSTHFGDDIADFLKELRA